MDEAELEQIQQQCIFCQIVLGNVPAKKIYEDEKTIGVLDINPASQGHVLLLPKKHYSIMPQVPEDELGQLGMVTKGISHAMIKALEAKGTTIFIANGGAAGQRALHFMIHIIPRQEKDDVGMIIPARQIKKEDLMKVKEVLKPSVNKQFGITEKEEPKTEEQKKENKAKEEEKEDETSGLDDISEFLTKKK